MGHGMQPGEDSPPRSGAPSSLHVRSTEREAERIFKQVLSTEGLSEIASRPIFATDAKGRLVFVSEAFSDAYGFRQADHLGTQPPHPWWPAEDCETWSELARLVGSGLAAKLGLHAFEMRLARSDGKRVLATVLYRSVLDESGAPIFDIAQVVETEQRSLTEFQRLQEIAFYNREITRHLDELGVPGELRCGRPSPSFGDLSAREREVMRLLLDGGRPAAIARLLSISPHTVRNHVKAIFRKLGVHSQMDLICRFRPGPRT